MDAQTLYLNHAGTSWPKPPRVRAAVERALDADPATWAAEFAEHHAAVARAFGLASPDRLLLTPGCTSALAIALADLPWRPGDRVLTSSLEHHAVVRPLLKLQERGVTVTFLPRASTGPLDLDAARAELVRGDVRLVAVSAAANVTGERLPVAALVREARAAGALVLVDGAQVAGWDDIDLPALGVDLFAFAGHKGPQAPWGIGGLYVAPGVRMQCLAAVCELPTEGGGTMPSWCDVGSVDRLALAGLAAGLGGRDPGALARARRAAQTLRSGLGAIPGVRVFAGSDLPTVAFVVGGRSPSAIGAALAERGIVVASGLQCAPRAHEALGTDPEGVVRISFGPDHDEPDATRALDALRVVLLS